jgi:flavin-dependent dehydrogenase
MLDVLIAGGGPAGAVTGIRLMQAGVRVAIVEATGYDTDRFGETLPPEINPVLRELGLWDAFQALRPTAAPGIVSRWGTASAVEQDFVSNPHGSGWRVDRNAFDAMLLREAERAGAQVFPNRRVGVPAQVNGAWVVDGIHAGVLVDATGRVGLKLDDRNEREVDDVLLAIAMVIAYEGVAPTDGRTYIETTPSGWWYSGRLPEGMVMAMFFTDAEQYGDGIVIGDQLVDAPLTRARLAGGRIARSSVVHAPSSCRRKVVGAGWLAVGDSASCYDPLSGRGIFKAIRHGEAAARAIAAGSPEQDSEYAKAVRQEFDAYVRQRRTYYAAERRWEGSGFWARRRG